MSHTAAVWIPWTPGMPCVLPPAMAAWSRGPLDCGCEPIMVSELGTVKARTTQMRVCESMADPYEGVSESTGAWYSMRELPLPLF
jgi:hypothetical protein